MRKTDFTVIDEKPTAPTEYVYDESGVLTRENSISAIDGKPYLSTIYTYNPDGSNQYIQQVGREGEVYSTWEFENFPEENYSEITSFKGDKTFEMKLGVQRDERCRISKISYIPYLGLSVSGVSLTYDIHDDPISLVGKAFYVYTIEDRRFEYEFDEVGNWIKKSELSWRANESGEKIWKLMKVEFRQIEYYKI